MRYRHSSLACAVLLAMAGCTSSPAAVGGSPAVVSGTGSVAADQGSTSVAPPVTAPALSSNPPSSTTRTTAPSSTAPSSTTPSSTTLSSTTASTIDPLPPATPGTTLRTTTPHSNVVPHSTVPHSTAPHSTAKPATVPKADLNAAGPDNGPVCAVSPQYSDEAPTGLRPDVLAAWVAVKNYAKKQDVALCLNDGKRTTAQQLALYADYVKEFGRAAADVYVLPPAKSAHVKGYAVDVQPAAAFQWLQATKGARGWCRIYDNEPWHFEYSRAYTTAGCPARLPKPVR